jgi:hypothetical protein
MMKSITVWSLLLGSLVVCACQTSDTSEPSLVEGISSDALPDTGELTGDSGEAADALPTGDRSIAHEDTAFAGDASMDLTGDAPGDVAEPTTSGTTVTFTTYIDGACTQTPPQNSEVFLDTAVACNVAPKASISDLVCHPDKITYMNHPNNQGCSSAGIFNELPVGVCQEFPGPVQTWKFIVPETYDCLSHP